MLFFYVLSSLYFYVLIASMLITLEEKKKSRVVIFIVKCLLLQRKMLTLALWKIDKRKIKTDLSFRNYASILHCMYVSEAKWGVKEWARD